MGSGGVYARGVRGYVKHPYAYMYAYANAYAYAHVMRARMRVQRTLMC